MDAYDLVTAIRRGRGTLAQHVLASGRSIQLLDSGGWFRCEPESSSGHVLLVDDPYVPAAASPHGDRKPFQPLERLGVFG